MLELGGISTGLDSFDPNEPGKPTGAKPWAFGRDLLRERRGQHKPGLENRHAAGDDAVKVRKQSRSEPTTRFDETNPIFVDDNLFSRRLHRLAVRAGCGNGALYLVVCDDPMRRGRTGLGRLDAKGLLHTG